MTKALGGDVPSPQEIKTAKAPKILEEFLKMWDPKCN